MRRHWGSTSPRCPSSTGRPTRSDASPFARVTSSPAGGGREQAERMCAGCIRRGDSCGSSACQVTRVLQRGCSGGTSSRVHANRSAGAGARTRFLVKPQHAKLVAFRQQQQQVSGLASGAEQLQRRHAAVQRNVQHPLQQQSDGSKARSAAAATAAQISSGRDAVGRGAGLRPRAALAFHHPLVHTNWSGLPIGGHAAHLPAAPLVQACAPPAASTCCKGRP